MLYKCHKIHKHASFTLLGQCSFTCLILKNLVSKKIYPSFVAIENDEADYDPFKDLVINNTKPNWFLDHLFYHRNWKETIKVLCEKHSIPYRFQKDIAFDLPICKILIVGGYAKKIPNKLLHIYEEWAINIHPSLLPMYKGPQPEAQIILNNENKYAGISLHRLTTSWDSGAIYYQKGYSPDSFSTVGQMESVEAKMASEGIEHILNSYPLVSSTVVVNRSNTSYHTWYDEEKILDLNMLRISDPAAVAKLRLRPEGYAFYKKKGMIIYPIFELQKHGFEPNSHWSDLALLIKAKDEDYLTYIEHDSVEFLEDMGIHLR